MLTFDWLVTLLMSPSAEKALSIAAPLLTDCWILDAAAVGLLAATRVSQGLKAVKACRELLSVLRAIEPQSQRRSKREVRQDDIQEDGLEATKASIRLAAAAVVDVVSSRRHYMTNDDDSLCKEGDWQGKRETLNKDIKTAEWWYDPRMLVFEFAFGLLLRGAQVDQIQRLSSSAALGVSTCQQMIMGGGKVCECVYVCE